MHECNAHICFLSILASTHAMLHLSSGARETTELPNKSAPDGWSCQQEDEAATTRMDEDGKSSPGTRFDKASPPLLGLVPPSCPSE
jgi:hypothetical protein